MGWSQFKPAFKSNHVEQLKPMFHIKAPAHANDKLPYIRDLVEEMSDISSFDHTLSQILKQQRTEHQFTHQEGPEKATISSIDVPKQSSSAETQTLDSRFW